MEIPEVLNVTPFQMMQIVSGNYFEFEIIKKSEIYKMRKIQSQSRYTICRGSKKNWVIFDPEKNKNIPSKEFGLVYANYLRKKVIEFRMTTKNNVLMVVEE